MIDFHKFETHAEYVPVALHQRYSSPLNHVSHDNIHTVARRDRKSIYGNRLGAASLASMMSSFSSSGGQITNRMSSHSHTKSVAGSTTQPYKNPLLVEPSMTSLNTVIALKEYTVEKEEMKLDHYIQEMVNISFLDSRHMKSKVMLGYMYLLDENPVAAEYHLEMAVKIGVGNVWSVLGLGLLGKCMRELGRIEKAVEFDLQGVIMKRSTGVRGFSEVRRL